MTSLSNLFAVSQWRTRRLEFIFESLLLIMLLASSPAQAGLLFSNIFSFAGTNGSNPGGALLQTSDGTFYGTTGAGGTNGGHGTIFRMTPGGAVTSLVSFSGTNGAFLGTEPISLVQGADGNFYGTTSTGGTNGGTNGFGTLFRMSSSGTLTTLISFSGTNGPYLGANPGPLIQGVDGSFYGTTQKGGSTNSVPNYGIGYNYGYGTVFQITSNGAFHTLLVFTGTNGTALGHEPTGRILQGVDGKLYGTTEAGGTNRDNGTVFSLTTNGALVWSFSFANTNGADPQAGLAQGLDGNLYGTTSLYSATLAGSPNGSTVFKITTNGILTTLYFFFKGSMDSIR